MSERPSNLLVGMLVPAKTGDRFDNGTPLHVTVQPWFNLGAGYERAFANALTNHTYEQSSFVINGGERALYGDNNDVAVTKVARGLGKLAGLHRDTLELVQRFGGRIDSAWIGERYSPHVSDDAEGRSLEPGEEFCLRAIQLIQRDPESDSHERRLGQTFYFSNRAK